MESMKEGLNSAAIERIANVFSQVLPGFDGAVFSQKVNSKLDSLELKERVHWIIEVLHGQLPNDLAEMEAAWCEIPKVWDYGDPNDAKRGFAAWPIIDYVGVYGLGFPDVSLRILERLTPLFSAEFAIRPFLENHYDLTMQALTQWCSHSDEHVRRLASEGCRPRLPWAPQLKQFIQNPEPLLPILEALRLDAALYVRRSVANNLNDIGKNHPELVLTWLSRWKKIDQGKSDWVITHAVRSLVKKGHPESFVLLGYTRNPKMTITHFSCPESVAMGDEIEFSFNLVNHKANQKCVIDYAVAYMKSNGKQSTKVYKLKNLSFNKEESVGLKKKISFSPISTRRYYKGAHAISIMINGKNKYTYHFEVV